MVEFDAARHATQKSYDHYCLTPREAYVLRSAPIRGLNQRRRGAQNVRWTLWFVGDEDLSNVVEKLLQRGFLAHRSGTGPAYVELTAEGRAALQAGQPTPLR
jgi:hypothetical protein